MNAASRSPRRWALDLGAVVLLLVVVIVGFQPSFGSGAYLAAAIGGMLLGLAIALLALRGGWGVLSTAGLTVLAYFVFGGALALPHTAIAGFIPTLETLRQLALGVVTSWKDMLTTVAPVAAADGHLIVPFLLMLVASVLTASLALRAAHPGWSLIPAGAALAIVIALGTPDPAAPILQGLVFAVVSIVWLSVRQIWAPQNATVQVSGVDPSRSRRMRMRRLVSGAVVVAVAAGTGAALSAATAPGEVRHVLRDVIVPPFDVRNYPSALQSFRGYVRDDGDATLFTVEGLPAGARIRLAAMDEFDGQVINVTDGGPGTTSAFTPIRAHMSPDAAGTPATLRIEIDEYSGVWVPTAGSAEEIRFDGADADALRRSTYYSTGAGTAVTTGGLAAGDDYTIETVIPAAATDEQLADAGFGNVRMPKSQKVPDELSSLAGEITADATTPVEQVRALAAYLSGDGFFSHGLQGEVISRAGHTSERISTLVSGDQMIGDDEQYAVAMALLAGELGIPARVVMGFYPDEADQGDASFTATGENVHAWVEVNFDGFGWVPFDATPPEDQIPNEQNTKPRADPQPQVLQPPPPPQEPADLPPTLPDDREAEDEEPEVPGFVGVVLAIGGITLGTVLLLASPFIVIGAWKASRRRARRLAERPSDRISGGWDELTDRAVDYGARFAPGATRAEEAAHVAQTLAAPTVTALADRADAEVFGPEEPTPAQIEAFWMEVDDAITGLGVQAGFWKRVRARLSLRSVLDGSAVSRGVQGLRDAASTRIRSRPDTARTAERSSSEASESERS